MTPTAAAPRQAQSSRGQESADARDVMVHVAGLSKRFPVRRTWGQMLRAPRRREHQQSLLEVSLDVRAGEFFGLLGPNGAGKTTLFKTLATLVIPDAGSATVGGYDVVRQPERARRLLTPVLANERSLYWRLSARENLRLYAALQGLSRTAAAERIEELLALVELADVGQKIVAAFSSGMMQRLLIARALLSRPRVLLLDEPTRSLDPISARSFRRFLREEIAGRQQCTVLLATHSAEEALELCDRVGILNRGRLLAVGTTAELAREFGDERYVLVTTEPRHAALTALHEQRRLRVLSAAPDEDDGWWRVELELTGGLDAAARTLDALGAAGVRVARFERVPLPLADLIERVVQHRQEAS